MQILLQVIVIGVYPGWSAVVIVVNRSREVVVPVVIARVHPGRPVVVIAIVVAREVIVVILYPGRSAVVIIVAREVVVIILHPGWSAIVVVGRERAVTVVITLVYPAATVVTVVVLFSAAADGLCIRAVHLQLVVVNPAGARPGGIGESYRPYVGRCGRTTVNTAVVVNSGIIDDGGVVDVVVIPATIHVIVIDPGTTDILSVYESPEIDIDGHTGRTQRRPAPVIAACTPVDPCRTPFITRYPHPTVTVVKHPATVVKRRPSP